MGFEELPGYDAWKTRAPEYDNDYEAGLAHYAPQAAELCEEQRAYCPHARWEGPEGEDFAGCDLGVTDASLALVGDGELCVEVKARAEDFDAKEYYADLAADARGDC